MENKEQVYQLTNAQKSGNLHISFSEFNLFNQCGHLHLIQKYLKLEEQLPSIHLYFGNAIHASIELSLKQKINIEKRVAFFRDTFKKDMLNNMQNDPSFKELDDFLDQGENILRILEIEKIFIKYDIIAIEVPLYEKITGKFYFKGFIDLIVRNKKTGRYLIIDWKTSGEEWNIEKKMKDIMFLCQMKFYKFFYARKYNIELSQIDCKYIVLNRLKNKKQPKGGFGKLQPVSIEATEQDIFKSLEKLADTVQKIHVKKEFHKVKIYGSEKMGCMFCPYKGGQHPLCNSNPEQHKILLKEHKKG